MIDKRNSYFEQTLFRSKKSTLTWICDNKGAVTQYKELRNHRNVIHIEGKYHLISEIMMKRYVIEDCFYEEPGSSLCWDFIL